MVVTNLNTKKQATEQPRVCILGWYVFPSGIVEHLFFRLISVLRYVRSICLQRDSQQRMHRLHIDSVCFRRRCPIDVRVRLPPNSSVPLRISLHKNNVLYQHAIQTVFTARDIAVYLTSCLSQCYDRDCNEVLQLGVALSRPTVPLMTLLNHCN